MEMFELTANVEGGIAGSLEGHDLTAVGNVAALFPEAVDPAVVTYAVMARVIARHRRLRCIASSADTAAPRSIWKQPTIRLLSPFS